MESEEMHSSAVYSSSNVQENDSERRLLGIGPSKIYGAIHWHPWEHSQQLFLLLILFCSSSSESYRC